MTDKYTALINRTRKALKDISCYDCCGDGGHSCHSIDMVNELAVEALSEIDAVAGMLEKFNNMATAWVNYNTDMRPETRNHFLRVCSAYYDGRVK
jgi:hypothetical protein